jgi:hypothetical protein
MSTGNSEVDARFVHDPIKLPNQEDPIVLPPLIKPALLELAGEEAVYLVPQDRDPIACFELPLNYNLLSVSGIEKAIMLGFFKKDDLTIKGMRRISEEAKRLSPEPIPGFLALKTQQEAMVGTNLMPHMHFNETVVSGLHAAIANVNGSLKLRSLGKSSNVYLAPEDYVRLGKVNEEPDKPVSNRLRDRLYAAYTSLLDLDPDFSMTENSFSIEVYKEDDLDPITGAIDIHVDWANWSGPLSSVTPSEDHLHTSIQIDPAIEGVEVIQVADVDPKAPGVFQLSRFDQANQVQIDQLLNFARDQINI